MNTTQTLIRPVLIMAGGTGGHVFPALALARLLRGGSQPVVWLGTRRGLEARVVPAEGIAIEWLSIGGLRGKSVLTLLLAPLRLTFALWQALRIMRRLRPAVVVGLGGFVTGPGGLAAWLCRRPLLIHEQNAVAGFTNRCLARFADEVLTAFPGAFASEVPVQQIGNPVRLDISGMPGPALRWAHRVDTLRVLVVGGSLGAMRLNTVVAPALALLQREGFVCQVRHQAGERGLAAAQAAYQTAGLAAEVTAFVDDMAGAYAWADVVICRAGALTVSELAAAGLPELAVTTSEEYEELAVSLAQDPDRLFGMRRHLENCRDSCAAFDTARWVRNFEAGLDKIWSRLERKDEPEHVEVTDDAPVFVLQEPQLL
jgi:UDP-N-acetylglucosamine--N-acetylmuramyl-(pentapeptide) pyrophosphoryl-undecaprenol N-acetylglucosamine transferase